MGSAHNLMDEKEVAAVLNVSLSVVRKWRYRPDFGGLPVVKIGSLVRYRHEDLVSFLERSTVKPLAEPCAEWYQAGENLAIIEARLIKAQKAVR